MFLKPFLYLFVLVALVSAGNVVAQDVPVTDSLIHVRDTLVVDTLTVDTLAVDTLRVDSTSAKPHKEPPFKTRVKYKATDSIKFNVVTQRAYMYKETQVDYEDIELTAFKTEFDMATKVVYAQGGRDSLGHYMEAPVFKQGGSEFDADSLSYNFDTKKGVIHRLKTHQGEGYMHAEKSKRYADGHIDMAGGKYTTCDADHPHFYLALSKAKVIPGDQVVFGPAHLVLLDVPLPLFLPFGFFPQTNKQAVSGILPPTIGMEVSRGLSLTNGGYYFAFSDHFDATIRGDIWSTGSWKTNLTTRYLKRYKFSGNVDLSYGTTVSGEKGLDQSKTKQYSVNWSHRQDPKANPNRSFTASVNYSSTSYDKEFNYMDNQKMYNNTKNSSIAYQQNWPNSPLHFTTDMSVNQNSTTQEVTLNFPRMTFSVDRIYPFRKKESVGKPKWYEDITFQYNADLSNRLNGTEGDLFSDKNLRKMENGFQHKIPFSINFKALKFINITPSMNYTGVVFTSKVDKYFDADAIGTDGSKGAIVTDTIFKPSYAHALSPSLSIGATPKFYLMNVYGPNSKVEAIRTVISPRATISYTPDLSTWFNYYRTVENPNTGQVTRYSIYENSHTYSPPSAPGQSGSINVGINGNVEMKVRSAKDSTGTSRKIKILDQLDFASSYNMFSESDMKWSPVAFRASTTIAGINLSMNGTINPYKLTPEGQPVNEFGPRLTNVNFNTGLSLPLQKKEKKSGGKEGEKTKSDYSYFDVPWNVTFNYTFGYAKPTFDGKFTQNLSFSGNVNLTQKWLINFSSTYDFDAKKIAYATVGIQRDLHCWAMSLNFSPFGVNKYFFFQINVKSSTLRDLKYEKRKSQSDFSRNPW